jgi:hypothetical protein
MLPITMGCDSSHPPSYKYSMIGLFYTQGKIRRFTQNIKNKKKDLGIKLMDKNPLSRPLLSCGLIIPHLCPCPLVVGITFYLLKFRNTICIYITWPQPYIISTLCIN